MPLDNIPSLNSSEAQSRQNVPAENFTLQQMQAWQGKLVKADFHGCDVEGESIALGCGSKFRPSSWYVFVRHIVIKAKHPSLVGLCGIVAQETEGTFRIVTPWNLVKGGRDVSQYRS